MKNAIEIENLSYSYGGNENQLHNVNLTIKEGEVVVITGPSGSGKSTLSKVINGLIPYFYGGRLTGSVKILGEDSENLKTWQRSFLIGNVFQNPRSQFFSNEVAGEIAFGCDNLGLSHKDIVRNVNKVSKELELEQYLYDKVRLLSFGMRQKVAIASAKAINPPIYVMDEPSANLDMNSTLKFAEMIKLLKSQGKTIIIAEHRLYYLKGIVDRILYIKNGNIHEQFTEKDISEFDHDKNKSYGLRAINLNAIAYKKSDKKIKNDIVLRVDKLNKKFGNNHILKDISFNCSHGEIVAIVGLNSCGKSTLGKLLAGLLKEDSGKIFYNDGYIKSNQRLSNIWYVSQDLDTQLFGESVLDELLTGKKITNEKIKKATEILSELDLIDLKNRHPSSLSGGQKQRLALAIALMNEAKVIILDEPTSGLDAKNMRNVSKQIKRLSSKGHIILMITHDIECAMDTCERVIHIKNGSVFENKLINNASELIKMCVTKDMSL